MRLLSGSSIHSINSFSITTRPKGAGSPAINNPWYRLVTTPARVPDAYPPSPLVTNHSQLRPVPKAMSAPGFVEITDSLIRLTLISNASKVWLQDNRCFTRNLPIVLSVEGRGTGATVPGVFARPQDPPLRVRGRCEQRLWCRIQM